MDQPEEEITVSGRKLPKVGVGKAGLATGLVGALLAGVYLNEGGYVNDKADPGGETNLGITVKEARANDYTGRMIDLQKHCQSDADVCADSIYFEKYVIGPGWGPMVIIAFPVAKKLVDTTVNMGTPRPSRWFQQAVGVTPDGVVGNQTITAYIYLTDRIGKKAACVQTLDKLDAAQKAEYLRLVKVNPKLKKFERGWLKNRIGNVDRRECNAV